MRLLSRYFAARFLKLFGVVFIASIASIAVVEMLLNFDDMFKTQQGGGAVLSYLMLRIPSYYLKDVVPVAAFTAGFLTLASASDAWEVLPVKSGGISPRRTLSAILLAGLVLALATFALNETLVLRATQGWQRLARGDEAEIVYRQGSFWYHRGHTIYNFGEADRSAHTLRGLRIFERTREGRIVSVTQAETAIIEDPQRWRLINAAIYRFPAVGSELSIEISRHEETVLTVVDASEAALMDADASTLSLPTLLHFMRAAPTPERERRLRTYFHNRIAAPLTVALFTFLALPLGLQVESTRSYGKPALFGVAILATYYSLRSLTTSLETSGLLAPGVAPWSLLAFFAAWGTWRFARMPS